MMPLMANDTTPARAATIRTATLRWRTSAKIATTAQATPRALNMTGIREDRVGEAAVEEISGRRRRRRRSAATPMAATTTSATGLKNAGRPV